MARKQPAARRAEILSMARSVFAANGYRDAAVADVAVAAEVSKGLVYRYFPDGRPEIFVGVIEDLLAEFQQRLRQAANAPFSVRTRLEHLLGALFGFFAESPEAYRLLFRDPWAAYDAVVESAAIAARVQLATEIATVMARSGLPAEDLMAASSGILGFALANVELCLTDQVSAETAWRVTCDYATAQLPS